MGNKMKQFDSVLVANRGEIACRVIRSAQQQGYRAIAVYSEADAGAAHVAMADEAVLIGPAPVKDSYLRIENIINAARVSGAQAIHPGYGFLSENAYFCRACEEAGIVFIGPSIEAIDVMGNKAASKRRMLEADVPCIPGYQAEDQSDEALLAAAESIGTPIMVKAAAGGGGRGMRLVTDMAEMPQALSAARSEAENAFASGELILEKAVMQPRHVEVQVFGDTHGNVVHLGERDCSVQRRHQKVVEEAPCPVMTPALRDAMGQAAVAAARSINYVGAGTVEFLLDADGNFYFLEMNTRLQVEHPVTEMITGLDLVALQFSVAQGYALPLAQEDVRLDGHAIEVRLYAEDTANDFLPATGVAARWQIPEGEGIRVDHGLASGQEVSPFYDPMLAKIIAWGEDREIARRRLLRALKQTVLFGVPNNRQFLIDVLEKPAFAAGEATTAFIAEQFDEAALSAAVDADAMQLALAACLLYRRSHEVSKSDGIIIKSELDGFSGTRALEQQFVFAEAEQKTVAVKQKATDCYDISVADQSMAIECLADNGTVLRARLDSLTLDLAYLCDDVAGVRLLISGQEYDLHDTLAFSLDADQGAGSGSVTAPMHGNVLEVFVAEGERVTTGQALAVMEAMKMEHRLLAEVDGIVTAVYGSAGQQLSAGAVLMEIDADDAS
jgi:geranyl-CoA carboxylase alpha subunit